MEVVLYACILLLSAGALYVAGEWVVHGLIRIARVLRAREFVVAFFVMACAASLPNLFVGITSALGGIPQLSLGDVFGNNLIAMTVAVAVAVFFSRGGRIPVADDTVRMSMFFTAAAAALPVVLLYDGELGRTDGFLLLMLFVVYTAWLLLRSGRHHARLTTVSRPLKEKLQAAIGALKETFKVVAGVVLLIAAAYGIVQSASFFAGYFGASLLLVGLLVVGFGNALPEVYFSVLAARRGQTSLIMGNLIGSVIVPATFVLGTVALLAPIHASNLLFLAEIRAFLLIAAGFFFLSAITRRSIGRVEAVLLLLLYIVFVSWILFTAV